MDKKIVKKNKKETKKNNDIFSVRNIIIACITVLLVFTMLLIILLSPNSKKSNSSGDGTDFKGSNEVISKLKQIGSEYYEKEYYPYLEDKEFILSNYSITGITATLDDIKLFYSFGDEVDKLLSKNNCDLDASKIVFRPKEPYKDKDYDIDVKLHCEN